MTYLYDIQPFYLGVVLWFDLGDSSQGNRVENHLEHELDKSMRTLQNR